MYRTYQTAASGPDVHHDTLLSNIAVAAFDSTDAAFVGDRLFPGVTVGKQADRYLILDKGQFLRNPDSRRAPRTEARRIEWEVSSDGYFCDNYALATEIALEDLDNADTVFMLRENATNLVITDLRRDQEVRIANIVSSISNVGSGVALTGTAKWSDYVNSDPIGTVNTGHAFIQHTTGLIANTMVVDYDTSIVLMRHPDLLDMYKYTAGGMITLDQMRQAFRVDNIMVARGVIENSLQGGTTSMTNIWGNTCFLAYVGPASGPQARTFGARFQWRPASFPAPMAAHTRRESGAGTKNVEIIQAEYYQDEKVIARDLGYTITGTL